MSLKITQLAMDCGKPSLNPAYVTLFAVHKLQLSLLNTFGLYKKMIGELPAIIHMTAECSDGLHYFKRCTCTKFSLILDIHSNKVKVRAG